MERSQSPALNSARTLPVCRRWRHSKPGLAAPRSSSTRVGAVLRASQYTAGTPKFVAGPLMAQPVRHPELPDVGGRRQLTVRGLVDKRCANDRSRPVHGAGAAAVGSGGSGRTTHGDGDVDWRRCRLLRLTAGEFEEESRSNGGALQQNAAKIVVVPMCYLQNQQNEVCRVKRSTQSRRKQQRDHTEAKDAHGNAEIKVSLSAFDGNRLLKAIAFSVGPKKVTVPVVGC